MRILIASPEVAPFAKTGGLADVAGALPKALAALGHDVRVVMPLYRCVDPDQYHLLPVMRELDVFLADRRFRGQVFRTQFPNSTVPVYFVQCPALFDRAGLYGEGGADYPDNPLRFAFASLAAIWMLKGLDWSPDVIQANDWQMALIPTYLRKWPILFSDPFYSNIAVLFTIHNLAYQGLADPAILPEIGIDWGLFNPDGLEFFDKVNLLKAGILFSDHISTVSPRYAKEIQTEEHGCGLHGVLRTRGSRLTGILNGIDDTVWNPATDPLIPENYSEADLSGKAVCKATLQMANGLPQRPDTPLIGMISRLAEQKGFDLIAQVLEALLERDVQMVLLGTGDPEIEALLRAAAEKHPKKLAAHFAFDERTAHEIEAGADIFLMPSRYEPCGLNQLYSMRYGTIPVVHATGGLADSVTDSTKETLAAGTASGFAFTEYTPEGLRKALDRALAMFSGEQPAWRALVSSAMKRDHSWATSAKAYERLFQKMTKSS